MEQLVTIEGICFLFLWGGVAFVDRFAWRQLRKKIIIAAWAVVLAIALFLLIIDWDRPILKAANLAFIGAYIASAK